MKLVTLNAFLNFLLYFGVGLLLFSAFIWVYVLITPYNEFDEIRHRRRLGPAITLAGAMLGFAFPLLSASLHGINFLDFFLWGMIAAGVQVAVFFVYYRVLGHDVWQGIMEDANIPAALMYAAIAMVVGLFNAFSLVP